MMKLGHAVQLTIPFGTHLQFLLITFIKMIAYHPNYIYEMTLVELSKRDSPISHPFCNNRTSLLSGANESHNCRISFQFSSKKGKTSKYNDSMAVREAVSSNPGGGDDIPVASIKKHVTPLLLEDCRTHLGTKE